MNSTEHKIEYNRKELPASLKKTAIISLVIGLILVVAGYFVDGARSAFNNVILLMFLTSIGVGSLFLIAIEYIGGAIWSTPFRRISEFLGGVIYILPLAIIPLLFHLHDLFHWTHTEVVQTDKILEGKSGYLNEEFFIIRLAVFFIIWVAFYLILTRNSRKQDKTGDQLITKRNIRISAFFLPFFAITLTLNSIDWLMSMEPHWFSTIFGVYYFSGTVLAALAALTFLVIYLNDKRYLVEGLKRDHYYSLGALLFAFINFWAYIAFSQFLLIWYANLPEETFWFINRSEGSWMLVSFGLIIVHFVVPYAGLLSQPSKMNAKRLKIMSLWILFAHFYDLYWLAMPTFSPEGAVFGWIELGYPILTVGIVLLVFIRISRNKNLVPIGDPKLKRGLDFRL